MGFGDIWLKTCSIQPLMPNWNQRFANGNASWNKNLIILPDVTIMAPIVIFVLFTMFDLAAIYAS
jgi:hypothetical protein